MIKQNYNRFENRQGKRVLATKEGAIHDLKKSLGHVCQCFYNAVDKTSEYMSLVPPNAHARGLEATLMQTHFVESLIRSSELCDHVMMGRYKRLILHLNGYVILFKKLDRKGLPMNTRTRNFELINSQSQNFKLFTDEKSGSEPILYFGYKKGKLGAITDPQLIYIDEGIVRFVISESDIDFKSMSLTNNSVSTQTELTFKPSPTLKSKYQQKKAN